MKKKILLHSFVVQLRRAITPRIKYSLTNTYVTFFGNWRVKSQSSLNTLTCRHYLEENKTLNCRIFSILWREAKERQVEWLRQYQSFIKCKEFVETLSVIRYEFMANLYLCYAKKILYHVIYACILVWRQRLFEHIREKTCLKMSLRVISRKYGSVQTSRTAVFANNLP